MKKLWKKGEVEGKEYYTLANAWSKFNVYEKNSLTVEKIKELMKNGEGFNRDWGNCVDTYTKTREWPTDAVDLPPGVYELKAPDNAPMRLEKSAVRKDNYLPLESHKILVNDIRKFLGSKDVYDKLEFLYRRGYLLYGEPGTGKTAFIRNLVRQDMFSGSHIIWMNFIPPSNIRQALSQTGTLKVLVMEELLQESGQLSYEMKQLLDFMDGEHTIANSISIATTNYPHFLHKNLADRPSRFDVLFEMKQQPEGVVKNVLEQWLERKLEPNEIELQGYTLAQLKEMCLLHRFHGVSLKEAAKKMKDQAEKFKNNFTDKKGFGLGMGKPVDEVLSIEETFADQWED